jgi:hypothetical protein
MEKLVYMSPTNLRWNSRKFPTYHHFERFVDELINSPYTMSEVFEAHNINPGDSSRLKDLAVNKYRIVPEETWDRKAKDGKAVGGQRSRRFSVTDFPERNYFGRFDGKDLPEYTSISGGVSDSMSEAGRDPSYGLDKGYNGLSPAGDKGVPGYSGNPIIYPKPGEMIGQVYNEKHGYLKAEEHDILNKRNLSVYPVAG